MYANEADILNVALFGMTAKEWKDKNPNLDGNMRDYANILQLVILVNLENDILQHTSGMKKIESLDNMKLLDK